MFLKSALVNLSFFALTLGLSGCGLLGGNQTQGIGIQSKECQGDPSV
jgi:hypothetical protein